MVKDLDEFERNLTQKVTAMFSQMSEQLQSVLRYRPERMLTLQLHVTFEEAHELISLLQKMREEDSHKVGGGGSE